MDLWGKSIGGNRMNKDNTNTSELESLIDEF